MTLAKIIDNVLVTLDNRIIEIVDTFETLDEERKDMAVGEIYMAHRIIKLIKGDMKNG